MREVDRLRRHVRVGAAVAVLLLVLLVVVVVAGSMAQQDERQRCRDAGHRVVDQYRSHLCVDREGRIVP